MPSELDYTDEKNVESQDPKVVAVQVDDTLQDVDIDDPNLDDAGRFLAAMALRPDSAELFADYTPEEEKAMVRKADWIILPILLVAIMMGAVDKVALGTAAVLGLRADLGLVGQQYSWSSSLIFFGSLVSVFPALFFMQRYKSGKLMGSNVFIWGILSLCHVACRNFAGLAVCRFILGLFEALTLPGATLVITSWYSREEAVFRTAIVFSTLSSVTNGLLSYASSFLESSKLKQWQLLYILIGVLTLAIGIVMIVFLPDAPYSAWWLTPRQRVIAVKRLENNKIGIMNKTFKLAQAKEAVLDPKSWFYFLINICLNVPSDGILTFYSIIVASLGYSTRNATLLAIPTGLVSYAAALIFSYIATKSQYGRCFTAIASCFVPLLATILLHVIPRSNIGGSLASLMLIYAYWAPYVVMNTLVAGNTGGFTKKTVVYGIAYLGYLVGNIIGPQTFKAEQAPTYTGGVVGMLICYCIAILLILAYYLYIRRLQSRTDKDARNNTDDPAEVAEGAVVWKDETDKENKSFAFIR
ncbi:hypothetical protein I350_08124 [Cryptococcus amylolentus CBS 6273]|uniref:Major facilitator superfamily (MFS) profile domain-containing protein n=1 Tax=Cryptococcus amylolentus CBS 6273 TaxID=1296118 RepID=A0A1E3J8G5_9TREE|nr:hypothetical protein I350_08124 [Cryptococcus amylolentus CBS 6273]